MTDANQNRQSSIRLLPKGLKILICMAALGMLVISVASDTAGTVLATAYPGLYRHLSYATPSLRELRAQFEGGLSSEEANSTMTTPMAQAVTELYGIAIWGAVCIIAVAAWACIFAPRVTFANQPGTERSRVFGLGIFLLVLAGAMTFFGLYPFRSDGLLLRGGILDSSALWWPRTFSLTGACIIGIMVVIWALIILLKSKRAASS
jgi:hypothetical protein